MAKNGQKLVHIDFEWPLGLIIVFSLSGLSKPVITNHNFLAVYFDHRHKDLKLLLNLLAETSGLPESFRILTLFDKKFQSLWKPQNLRFEEYETVGIEGLWVVGFPGTFRDKLFCPRTKPGQKKSQKKQNL